MADVRILFLGGPLDRKAMLVESINHHVDGYRFELAELKQVGGCEGSHVVPVMIADDKRMDDALVDLCDISDILEWFFTQRQPTSVTT